MVTSESFRFRLSKRILALVAVAFPMGALIAPGCDPFADCGGEVITENRCFTWPAEGSTGGAGGMGGGAAGMAGGGGMGGNAPVMCPAQADAKPIIEADFFETVTMKSDGTLADGKCCYDIEYKTICIGGRPFLVDETPRLALSKTQSVRGAWSNAAMSTPDVQAFTDEERAELAAAWARDGLFEHASVASFGRFALELMAVGAPAELISAAHEAALDEVRHARLCLSLAGAYAGHGIEPGAFPFDGNVAVSANLADLASRVAREGAIGETIAAVIAAEQLVNAEDPAVRAALSVIAEDEARHAELAFRTLVWAIQVGGAPVAEAVGRTFVEALRHVELPAAATRSSFAAHGRLGEDALRNATKRAIDDVLMPAITALGLGDQGRFTHAQPPAAS